MCAECDSGVTDLILDVVNDGHPLEVAIRLVRDVAVQRALLDLAGETALQSAIDFSDRVNEAGDQLRLLKMVATPMYIQLLQARRLDVEQQKESKP